MNREVLSKYDIMTVGEFNHTNLEQMVNFVHPDRHELQMGFTFEHVNLGRGGIDMAMVEPHKLSEFKEVLARWQGLRDRGCWHALYLENHDQVRSPRYIMYGQLTRQPRSISIYGNDSPEYRRISGRLLALMHTTLWGTVYLHQGQEIGLINLPKDWPLEEWKDCKTQNVAKK
jgi:alpha-glucosidase